MGNVGYWNTDEGKKVSGTIGKAGVKIFEQLSGAKDPTGNVSEAASQFAQVAIPVMSDTSQKMMENVYHQNQTEADRYMQARPFRSADGTPITANEAMKADFEKQIAALEEEKHSIQAEATSKAELYYSKQAEALESGNYARAFECQEKGDLIVEKANKQIEVLSKHQEEYRDELRSRQETAKRK